MRGFPRIDTHAHIFEPGLPTIRSARYIPSYPARLDEYLKTLTANGMDRGVLVQPSFLGTDNSYLLTALAAAPDRLRGVIVVPGKQPEVELAEVKVDALTRGGVRGIRLNLIGQQIPNLGTKTWQQAATTLARHGWHVEIQATPRQWRDLNPVVDEWPSKLVIDHFGLPDPTQMEGVDSVVELAAKEHVWVKFSAPYRSSAKDAEQIFNRLRNQGSTERLVFGSDWPFTRFEDNTYSDILTWAESLAGEELAQAIMGDNASRLLGWDTEAGGHADNALTVRAH